MRTIQSRDEEQRLRAFVRAIFSLPRFDLVLEELEEVQVPRPYRVRLSLLYSELNPTDLRQFLDRKFDTPLGDGAHLLRVLKSNQEGIPDTPLVFGRIALAPSMTVVASICTSDEWVRLKRRFSEFYPLVTSIHTTRKEFISAIANIQDTLEPRYRSRVVFASLRERAVDDYSSRSVVEWMDEQWESLLIRMKERHQELRSVKLSLFRLIGESENAFPVAELKVSRDRDLELVGLGRNVLKGALENLATGAQARVNTLSGRGLISANYGVSPIRIRFPPGTLETEDDSRRVVEVVKQMSRWNYTILHGNPFVSIEVSDIVDGSSFSLLSVSPGELILTPSLVTTPESLNVALQYLLERFADGEVDYGA